MDQIAAGPTAGLPPSPGSQAGPTGSNLLGTSQAPQKKCSTQWDMMRVRLTFEDVAPDRSRRARGYRPGKREARAS